MSAGESPPAIAALATAVPPHLLEQAAARRLASEMFRDVFSPSERERMLAVFDHAGVETRQITVPLSWFDAPGSFESKSILYREAALDLAASCSASVLERAGLLPGEIGHIVFVSSTGIACPTIDALLLNRMGFSSTVRRTPIWGLGCAGGAVGLSRAAAFARDEPGTWVLLVVVELCSQAFQRSDLSMDHFVAMSLFGDGAAAALVRTGVPGPRFMASSSVTWPGTLDVMGWDVTDVGLRVALSREIPTVVREKVRPAVLEFLRREGLDLADVRRLVAHPGGPKVMEALAAALELPMAMLDPARSVLRRFGNTSAASVLFVLEEVLARGCRAGDLGLLTALGPGFSLETVLLGF